MTESHEERLRRARISLEGLSVGDAFGDRFFGLGSQAIMESLEKRIPAYEKPWWRYTDDTNMSLSIYENLRLYSEVQQDELARSFAYHYDAARGYGAAMHGVLGKIGLGMPWRKVATELFSGQGSYGNGAAMRIPPLGAYFADDLEVMAEQAHLSAEITHAHIDGVAGAIATAIAAAYAWRFGRSGERPSRQSFIDMILPHVPDSIVKEKLRHARNLAPNASIMLAISALGNGSQISAQDTVPFVLWVAGEYLDNYEEAIWQTASAMGDVDTTCAMVGGIVALYTGVEGIPAEWIQAREPLPDWAFGRSLLF
jgi:ADP-ribosylglycohydrolase